MRLNTQIEEFENGTNILDIRVPDALSKTIKTGIDWFDEAYGGQGLTPSMVTLYTGVPGAGKTTSAIQLADAMTGNGHLVLYNTGEESLYQVAKVSKRLKLKHGFNAGQETMVKQLLKNADELREKNPNKQFVLIHDSLQTLDDGFYKDGHMNTMTAVRALKMITDYCKDTYAIAIVIGQVGKDGKFSGRNSLKHMVDSHCHLDIESDVKSDNIGQRIFEVQKNRFGPSGIALWLEMKEQGLIEVGSVFGS